MRVLVVGHSYLAGFNQRKLDQIAGMGVELGVLVPGNWRHIGGLFAGQPSPVERPYDSVRVFDGPVFRPGHVASFLFARGVVGRALNEFEPELVQIEQELYSFAAAQVSMAARARGKRVVLFSWENLDRRIHVLQRLARRISIRRMDGIISGNEAGSRLVCEWGFRGKTAVIPQVGVDTTAFAPRLRGASGRFIVGFVGRLVPEKGVRILIRAAASLCRGGADLGVVICGSGPEKNALLCEAEALGIGARVEWQDSVPHAEVPEIMARMDGLVLPSLRISSWVEQFGLVLPQAMAMGIPVLGSDTGAIPEVLGRRDLVFPEGDADALAGLLAGLISSDDRRQELRRHGIERVRALYSKERIAERTVEFWQRVADTRPEPA